MVDRRPRKVRTALEAELERLPDRVRFSSLALTALALAQRLDEAGLRDAAPLARELRSTMAALRAEMGGQEMSHVDDLAARRVARLADARLQAGPIGSDDGGA